MTLARHMARAEEELARLRPVLSLLLEVRDGRAPYLTEPRGLARALADLPRAVIFSKADIAYAPRLEEALRRSTVPAIAVDARKEGARLWRFVQRALGPHGRRLAVVGLPNVGKSTIVNRLVGGRRARTGSRPGVTLGVQWLKGAGFELLDTPGILRVTPRPELEALGILPRGSFPLPVVLAALWRVGHQELQAYYGCRGEDVDAFLLALARQLGNTLAGGEPDLERTAIRVLTDYQRGRLPPVDWEGEAGRDA